MRFPETFKLMTNQYTQLALNYFEFFERLTEMMERIGEHLKYLSHYGTSVFQHSKEVQEVRIPLKKWSMPEMLAYHTKFRLS